MACEAEKERIRQVHEKIDAVQAKKQKAIEDAKNVSRAIDNKPTNSLNLIQLGHDVAAYSLLDRIEMCAQFLQKNMQASKKMRSKH